MAAALASATPADGATGVTPNQSVLVNITDATDLDEALIEVTIDGISYTVANGGLTWWTGGAMTSLYAETQGAAWWAGQESVTVEVLYDAGSLGTLTWTLREAEPAEPGTVLGYFAMDSGTFTWGAALRAGYLVWDAYVGNTTGDLAYVVAQSLWSGMDARYLVGVRFQTDTPGCGVVGEQTRTDTPASGTVQGWTWNDTPGSAIVQGWTGGDTPSAGIVGLPVQTDSVAAGIVGVGAQTDTPAAGSAYAINARNSIEVTVADSTYTATLTALGITWS